MAWRAKERHLFGDDALPYPVIFFPLENFSQGIRGVFSRGPPIGGQDRDGASYRCSAPYTLLPLRGISPQGETRDMERKTGRHVLHVPFRCVPLWWLAPPPFPRKRGHYKAPLCCELLMKGLLFRALFFPLNRGKSGAAGKGVASAASQSAECLLRHMTLKVNPVTLTL